MEVYFHTCNTVELHNTYCVYTLYAQTHPPMHCVVYTHDAGYIGLKYAEEIGVDGDPNPRYFCHICKTHMDWNNIGLHFTSTAHRHNVLVRVTHMEQLYLYIHLCRTATGKIQDSHRPSQIPSSQAYP